MIDISDAVISSIQTIVAGSGFPLEITDVKLGDPGLVHISEYPYVYVQPVEEVQVKETISPRGYDVRDNIIEVGIVIEQSEYFDESVSEVSGLRELVNASGLIRSGLRTKENRSLGGIARDLKIPSIRYEPAIRGEAFTTVARITLIVQRQYQHQ